MAKRQNIMACHNAISLILKITNAKANDYKSLSPYKADEKER